MKEYVWLGSTPADEPCAQLGEHEYAERVRSECNRYIHQLMSVFQAAHNREPHCTLRQKGAAHDFGTYYEVVAAYDANDDAQVEDAWWFESNAPTRW